MRNHTYNNTLYTTKSIHNDMKSNKLRTRYSIEESNNITDVGNCKINKQNKLKTLYIDYNIVNIIHNKLLDVVKHLYIINSNNERFSLLHNVKYMSITGNKKEIKSLDNTDNIEYLTIKDSNVSASIDVPKCKIMKFINVTFEEDVFRNVLNDMLDNDELGGSHKTLALSIFIMEKCNVVKELTLDWLLQSASIEKVIIHTINMKYIDLNFIYKFTEQQAQIIHLKSLYDNTTRFDYFSPLYPYEKSHISLRSGRNKTLSEFISRHNNNISI